MGEIDEAVVLARLRADVASGKARRIRRQARLSQSEVAKAVGADRSTVANWEAGRRLPDREHAIRYAALLQKLESVRQEDQQWAS